MFAILNALFNDASVTAIWN